MTEQLNKYPGLTLYGAGGHCKVVIDILDSIGKKIDQIVDDTPKWATFMSIPCKPSYGVYDKVIVTIGNCQIRKSIVERIKANQFDIAIHPSSIISSHCTIGEGSVVMQGVVIQSCASVGNHCILNTKSSVGHDVTLHNFVHIASGATICGGAEIGECTWIGAGSVVIQGVHIGKNCMIGAGSVIVKDIPDNVVAYGNPCKVIRKK